MNKKRDALAKVGQRIREKRLSNGASQEALAEHCKLHRTYIGSVERGERNITLLNLIVIAHALKIDISKLVEDL